MQITFPNHPVGLWRRTPFWLRFLAKPGWRRRHWRWIVDWDGCQCVYYWQYMHGRPKQFDPGVQASMECSPEVADDTRLA